MMEMEEMLMTETGGEEEKEEEEEEEEKDEVLIQARGWMENPFPNKDRSYRAANQAWKKAAMTPFYAIRFDVKIFFVI